MCLQSREQCVSRPTDVNYALTVMKKIDSDLPGKVNLGRSGALSTKKLRARPKDQFASPEHAERTKRAGLRRLFSVRAIVKLLPRAFLSNGPQRVFTPSDAEVR